MRNSKDFNDEGFVDFEDYDDDDLFYEDENYIEKTFVCEDCDFRWTEKINLNNNDYPDYEDELGETHTCPMCGSNNVSIY
ncbi:MAG: hypothetical protein DRP84_05660 [Spirochaetes bacterium]|nr:MAG: hypothetical protein DRP84_05660 [Spirochaetota bacterium]